MAASRDRPLTPQDVPQQLQPGQPAHPDRIAEARPVDRPGTPDQPVPWSKADLRQRLERLPPSHPSSLRGADDEPNAPDLRQEIGPDRGERSLSSEVPRFMHAWADHLRTWPDNRETTKLDRSEDPDGSWRGDGNQYLNPDQHDQAKEVIAGVQEDEKDVTKSMRAAERENASGAWLEGIEHRLKGEERLKEKIADLLTQSHRTPHQRNSCGRSLTRSAIRSARTRGTTGTPTGIWRSGSKL